MHLPLIPIHSLFVIAMIKTQIVKRIIETEGYKIKDVFFMKGKVFSYVNPVSYLDALKHKELYSSMDGLFVDGSLMAAAVHLCYGKHITRRSPDMVGFFPEVFEHANLKGMSICVIGSSQEQLDRAIHKFSSWYPKIEWKCCRNGYFSSEQEMRDCAKEIVQNHPDFLICGLGSVLQERFLLMCRDAGFDGVGFSCGGFIRQIADYNGEKYYPDWINRMNLRFMYRMYKEPHTRKRYLIASFIFPIRFVWEKFFG